MRVKSHFPSHLIPKWEMVIHCIRENGIYLLSSIIFGIVYLAIIAPSGREYCIQNQCGIYFWGAHEHDALWHLALVSTSFTQLPFSLPILAGQSLMNYHFLFDLVIYLFARLGVNMFDLYFRWQALLWVFAFAYLMWAWSKRLSAFIAQTTRISLSIPLLATIQLIVVMFSSSFGWLFTWYHRKTLTGAASLFPMQGALGMTNPQLMWTFCMLIWLWIMLYDVIFEKKHQHRTFLLIGIVSWAALSLKAYVVVVLACTFGIAFVGALYTRHTRLIVASLAGIGGAICSYLLFYYHGSGGLVWKPFELVRSVYADPQIAYNLDTLQRWFFLKDTGHWSKQLLLLQIKATLLYTIATYGTRAIALVCAPLIVYQFVRQRSALYFAFLGTLCVALICAIPSILFIQKGVWWNSVQFLYYSIFILSFSTAWILMWIIHKNQFWGVLILVLYCVFQIPMHIDLFHSFWSSPGSHISRLELEALKKLQHAPPGVIYMPLHSTVTAHDSFPTRYDSSYVSAFTGKPLFAANKTQLELLVIDASSPLSLATQGSCTPLSQVQYLYLLKDNPHFDYIRSCPELAHYTNLFVNSEVSLWEKVN